MFDFGTCRADASFLSRLRHISSFVSYHDPSASLEEGIATLKRCLDEVSKRLVVSPGKYKVKVVDKDGVREIEI